jgi:NAD(P)-dependent dehydrogenase (short-subunit alcohol dehydrogenase family)
VPSALFVKCDVTIPSDVAGAFEKHVQTYGGLDVCVNCAGIITTKLFHEDTTDGTNTWRRTVDVNLIAVMDCTRIAIQIMRSKNKPGVIVNMGSASGLYPMSFDPVYSGTKGGVVLFTRSLAFLKCHGVRVNVLCPEFVQTDMAMQVNPMIVEANGGFLPMDYIIKGTFELIEDETKSGASLWVTNRRGLEYWPTPAEEKKYLIAGGSERKFASPSFPSITIPQSFEKM